MDLKLIFSFVGVMLLVMTGLLLIPFGIALYYSHPPLPGYMTEVSAFAWSMVISAAAGWYMKRLNKEPVDSLRNPEGSLFVVLSWVMVSVFGALPFYLSGTASGFTDAVFESVSGFTTTGAAVFTQLEGKPEGILFWRCMTQWMGGLGIIVTYLSLFPILGIGSAHLIRAEIPGGVAMEKVEHRLINTGRKLWETYLLLTLAEVILLWAGGMSLYDAVCHSFSTLSTGGFSPHSASVDFFKSPYLHWVIIVFMFLGGTNFALIYHGLRGNLRPILRNPELRFYLIWLGAAALITLPVIWGTPHGQGLEATARNSLFTLVSVSTTTGFSTVDFDVWPASLKLLLLALMMGGACLGSTSGAMKSIRILILFKAVYRELAKLVYPKAVLPLKIGDTSYQADQVSYSLVLTGLFAGISVVGALLLSLTGLDMMTSLSGSFATLCNVGPGFGPVGPTGNFADIPFAGKWIMIVLMLLGRLEIFPFLLVFFPMTWRK